MVMVRISTVTSSTCPAVPCSVFALALLLLIGDVFAGELGPQRVVFGTSVTGTADLGSWADAGMATGTAAGDAICQARATAAGLPNPGNYVAWLSDSDDDAYCRIHGFGGTRDANCGQAQLPVAAGPWQRTDGTALAPEIDRWLDPSHEMYTTIQYDEFGVQLPAFVPFFTATGFDGGLSGLGGSCGDWTTANDEVANRGGSDRSSFSWTAFGTLQCAFSNARLICIETGMGPALDFPAVEGSLVFLTDAFGSGDLGSWADAGGQTGIAAGDAICQAEAAAAQLPTPNAFVAWLSDSGVSAIERLTQNGPWIRVDGIPVAQNTADLTDGELFATINVTPSGLYLGHWAVWTGTNPNGTGGPANCDDWNPGSGAAQGGYGSANTIFSWTNPSSGDCGGGINGRLYCFSNAAPGSVFTHGYEDGDG